MSATAATIVHDPSEAEPLCPALGLYLKPITKLAISVALPPPPRPPGKSVSNWEVMERLKAMAAGAGPEDGVTAGVTGLAGSGSFSSLRIAKSTPEFVRFEGEVEQRALVRPILARLDGRGLKLAGFPDALRVRAAELRPHAPARRDWDAAATDADADEARPGERPDTIHLEGLPCRWFAPRTGGRGEAASASTSARDEAASASTSSRGEAASASTSSTSARSEATSFSTSTSTSSSTSARSEAASCGASASTSSTSARSEAASCGASASTPSSTSARSEAASSRAPASTPSSDRPSEALLRQAFSAFGEIRQVDIPMLDPYHEDAARGGGVIGVGGGVIGVGGGFHPFGWGGGLHFEAYVQYREHAGFARAMAALRGAKLMYKGDDGKAVACGIKVSFDATEHLSEASIRRRQLERQKLRELELQREEQKRREREEEERRRAPRRKQKQLEQQQRARRREEKLRRREQRSLPRPPPRPAVTGSSRLIPD
ncbi:A-kinase anchor protein 17A [Microtus ochrogaster]|uniref:A-kinase anchor protein 17A n=1 Tax=Microtus ochrogaster TaxID=79684 RepID=A0ABM1AZ91_MICOH|nr:A-kinase anchor protein 17A [Microtus ochrogaster]